MRALLLLGALFAVLHAKMYYIDFAGNKTFDKDRLYKEVGLERSFWQKWRKKLPQVDEKLLPSLYEGLELFYKEQGFWDANITTDLKDNKAIFRIQENSPIIIKNIAITSNFPITDKLSVYKNQRFIIPEFARSKERIKKALLQKGYCSYTFKPKAYVFHKKRNAYISIYLDKGKLCSIKDIDVKGLSTLNPKVVFDHIFVRPGDVFDKQKIDESYKRLYSLGYFRQIRFDYSKKVRNQVTLAIHLKERQKKRLYKVGVGYESDQGFIGSFLYKDYNLHSHQPQIKLRYSKLQKELAFSIFTPSIWHGHDMSNELAYKDEDFKQFKSRTYGYRFKLLQDTFTTSYAFGLEAERIEIYNTSSCIHERSYTFVAPYARYLLDRRDSKIFPTQGYFWLTNAAASLKWLGDTNYLYASSTLGYYTKLQSGILFAKARLAQILASGSLPPTKYLYAGGIKSNRAYGYRSIAALDSSCGLGGKSLLETTFEFRYPFKNIYGAIFWDRTYLNSKSLNFDKSVDGVGIGVLVPMQIGTIKAYFGLDPNNLSQNFLGLYIGAAF